MFYFLLMVFNSDLLVFYEYKLVVFGLFLKVFKIAFFAMKIWGRGWVFFILVDVVLI